MKPQFQCSSSFERQRNVISGQLNRLKTVPSLELGQTTIRVVIHETSIYEMRFALCLANLNGFCDQSVIGPLVEMSFHAEDLRYRSRGTHPCNFCEADQFVLIVSSDKDASLKIRRKCVLYRL